MPGVRRQEPLTFEVPLMGKLRAYYCTATNPRTGHPCRTVLIEAWAPLGAVVKRRCKKCGAWATIVVEASGPAERATIALFD
jgi:hypothetical protein